MAKAPNRGRTLFSALLKHWRGLRGMTQLDLALATEVSTRHISCLETGRAKPSEDMVLLLAANLDVPLREQNAMLEAAGFERYWAEPSLVDELDPALAFALERMFAQHEPFPMFAMNRRYDILRSNRAAIKLIEGAVDEAAALPDPLNAYRLLFDPALLRPRIVDWQRCGRELLSRLHREALHRPEDEGLRDLVEALFTYPDIPSAWRQPDFSTPNNAIYTLGLRLGEVRLRFLTTVTTFNAPSNITLEELQIESYFPLDEATQRACRRSFADSGDANLL